MARGNKNGSAARGSRRSSLVGDEPTIRDPNPVSAEIASLDQKGVGALRVAWAHRFRGPAPPIQSADILRRLFAWQLQTEAIGDLDPGTAASLKRARSMTARGKAPLPGNAQSLRTGTILIREWRGVTHRVLVQDKGFEYAGKRYGSLSEAARAISGTHWSGPRFFGLEERAAHVDRAESQGGAAT